jgi:hypothetical protein
MVGNGTNALFIDQQPPAGTLVSPGTHTVLLTIVDQFGNRQTCSVLLFVSFSGGSGLRCPRTVVTNCASAKGQYVNYEVSLCNTNYTLECTPPPGSLFPVGKTTVICKATGPQGITEQCSFDVVVNCVTLGTTTTGTNLTINWDGTGLLQKANALGGPWITISNAVSPYRTSPAGQQGYFRLLQQ